MYWDIGRLIRAVHQGCRIGWAVAAGADVIGQHRVTEFRMRLDGIGLIFVDQSGELAKIVASYDLSLGRQSDHLILVPSVEGDSAVTSKGIILTTNGPAAIKLLDGPAQCLSDHLMAKANSNHRAGASIDLCDQGAERRDKIMTLIDTML